MSRAPDHRLSIRIDLASGGRISPGKVALLEAIAQAGSISAAGQAMRMGFGAQSAWIRQARPGRSRHAQVTGDELCAQADERRLTERAVAVHALNRTLELGRPSYACIA